MPLTFLSRLLLASMLMLVTLTPARSQSADDQRILFILSADQHGYWLPEVLSPYAILTAAGYRVDFASPDANPGVQAGADQMNAEERRTLQRIADQLSQPLDLAAVQTQHYAALYVPGGAGPMFDLFDHPQVNRITANMYESGKPVSAACHGPAALAAVRLTDGSLLVRGKQVTAKSNAEEGKWARENYPFLLEDKLRSLDATFSATDPYEPWVVQDGNLLTGQNPASAAPLAHALIKTLQSPNAD
ncbi:MAG: type 1 glutamine amidotransferase domain-containing protein [Pseudomonadota bacterium]